MRQTLSLLLVITAAVLLSSVSPLRGQAIRMAASPAAAGGDTRVVVWLDAAPAKIALGMQVEIELPVRVLEIDGPADTGEAAKTAGKTATCNGQWKKAPQSYMIKCIVAGGRNPMDNGPVLVVKGKINPAAKPGNYSIKTDHALAVDAAFRSIPMKATSGTLTVTRK